MLGGINKAEKSTTINKYIAHNNSNNIIGGIHCTSYSQHQQPQEQQLQERQQQEQQQQGIVNPHNTLDDDDDDGDDDNNIPSDLTLDYSSWVQK
jgi:hypothetical protein